MLSLTKPPLSVTDIASNWASQRPERFPKDHTTSPSRALHDTQNPSKGEGDTEEGKFNNQVSRLRGERTWPGGFTPLYSTSIFQVEIYISIRATTAQREQ